MNDNKDLGSLAQAAAIVADGFCSRWLPPVDGEQVLSLALGFHLTPLEAIGITGDELAAYRRILRDTGIGEQMLCDYFIAPRVTLWNSERLFRRMAAIDRKARDARRRQRHARMMKGKHGLKRPKGKRNAPKGG
jgi:hypothetical protein